RRAGAGDTGQPGGRAHRQPGRGRRHLARGAQRRLSPGLPAGRALRGSGGPAGRAAAAQCRAGAAPRATVRWYACQTRSSGRLAMNSPATLSDELFAQLQGAPIQQISQQLGTDAAQTREAVGAALPMLLGSLGQNASQPQGAEALFGALQRDHAGGGADLGGLLGSLLGGGASAGQADGAGILGHIFGGNQQRAEDTLGQATGLGGNNAANLLKMLAPIVMALLAQRMQGGGMDAGGP